MAITAGLGSLLFSWWVAKFEWTSLAIMFSYIVIASITQYLAVKKERKIFKIINKIVIFPAIIIMPYTKLARPVIVVLMSCMWLIFTLIVSCFLTIYFFSLIEFNPSETTLLFVILEVGAFVSVYGMSLTHWLIRKVWKMHSCSEEMTDFAIYILNSNNVKFIIYLAYFVYLSMSAFMQIQYNKPLTTVDIDRVILSAFVIFLAFSSALDKYKATNIELKELSEKTIALMQKD